MITHIVFANESSLIIFTSPTLSRLNSLIDHKRCTVGPSSHILDVISKYYTTSYSVFPQKLIAFQEEERFRINSRPYKLACRTVPGTRAKLREAVIWTEFGGEILCPTFTKIGWLVPAILVRTCPL
jgi:hypothetical protein